MTADAPAISVRLAGARGAFAVDAAFDVPARGITALFGRSGAGKTTLLRAIAGLERLDGHVRVAGETWADSATGLFLPAHKRHVGLVFQEASLFPHLCVRDNLLYGARRAAGAVGAPDLETVAALLGVTALLGRAPHTLSGGERQRVAIGRALLSRPLLLLMDEPLVALDKAAKDEILPYLERLHAASALPILYVTHDLREVERLADRVVVIEAGRVRASGTLATIETDPSLPLAGAPEAAVVLAGTIAGYDPAFMLSRVTIPGAELFVPGRLGDAGDVRRLRIAAADVSLAQARPEATSILNCVPARIVSIAADEHAPHATVLLELGPAGGTSRILARITRRSVSALALAPGHSVFAQIKGVAIVASAAGAARPG